MKFLILGLALAYLLYEKQYYIRMSKAEFLKEHNRLLDALSKGDKAALQKEFEIQKKEMSEYFS
jgi:hypothetical protein